MDERLLTMLAQWASSASTNIPAPPVPGQAYRNAQLLAADIANGQRYSVIADSSEWNQLHYIMSGLLRLSEQYGILPYSPLTDYAEGGLVLGTDLIVYQAVQASGPSYEEGAQPTTNSAYWSNFIKTQGPAFIVGEYYNFRGATLIDGMQPRTGGLLPNTTPTTYPEIWAYLQTTQGAAQCVTEAQWQALSVDVLRDSSGNPIVFADGSSPSWNGIGGVPFFVQDLGAGTLRLPDTRGMYAEDSGFDSLVPGGVHGDSIRPLLGTLAGMPVSNSSVNVSGVLFPSNSNTAAGPSVGPEYNVINLDVSRTHPVSSAVKPRAYGSLACVYLGRVVA